MTAPAPAWPLTASRLLLLLLLLLQDPFSAGNCSFPDSPISSTFLQPITHLSDHLLKDYPVDVPDNLLVDERCWALWHLFLAKGTLDRLKLVAGNKLQDFLETVCTEVHFVTQCKFQSLPSCLRYRKANISHLLLDISSHLEALQTLITQQDFQPCLELRCQPESSTLPSPGSLGALGRTPKPLKHPNFLPLILGVLLILLLLVLVVAWRWKQRRRKLKQPGSPNSPTPQDMELMVL